MVYQKRPIRSAQAVSPFGPGALMDFPGPESLIHAGLDAWHRSLFEYSKLEPEFSELRIDNERRLARLLGVDFFLQPPPWEKGRPTSLPWLRFPRWHQCPSCGRMTSAKLEDSAAPQNPKCRKEKHQKPRQVRFVAACRHGHLRDFPWVEWLVHKNTIGTELQVEQVKQELGSGAYLLRMKSGGSTGGAGVEILLEKEDGGELAGKASLAGAFGGNPKPSENDRSPPLSAAGVSCRGQNPALGMHEDAGNTDTCDAPLIVTLRGASNLYFPVTASVIHIPDSIPGELRQELIDLFDDDDLMSRLLEKASGHAEGRLSVNDAQHIFNDPSLRYCTISFGERELENFVEVFNSIEPLRRFTETPLLAERARQVAAANNGELDSDSIKKILRRVCEPRIAMLEEWRHVPNDLEKRINEWLEGDFEQEGIAEEQDHEGRMEDLREREYSIFSAGELEVEGRPRSLLKIRTPDMNLFTDWFREYFDHVALIDSLRETRVLRGFDRLQSTSRSEQQHYSKLLWRKEPPSDSGIRWLPATVVFGEGLFLRFDEDRVREWEEQYTEEHNLRLQGVNRSLQEVRARRGQAEGDPVTAREVMIHTFAHMLINRLIFSSGYGSAALRERLYIKARDGGHGGMSGLLIYTAAGDSEGSMGGLVRQGEPGFLERAIIEAIESAMWCASDPVCIESGGQGPDACNLAACHSCTLLPETSCEKMNRFLDRGAVIGTLDKSGIGFFSDLCGRGAQRAARN